MAETSITNPEKPFKFQINPPHKLKNSTEFNNLNQTPSTKIIDFFKKINSEGLRLVESPDNSLDCSMHNIQTEELVESLSSNTGGLPSPDSSFVPRTLNSMTTSVNVSADEKLETDHLPCLISGAASSQNVIKSLLVDNCFGRTGKSDVTLNPSTIRAIRYCPVRKLADVDPASGNMPYPNRAVHHQANGVHENGVHDAENGNQNDGENGIHHNGENGYANGDENGNPNPNRGEDGGNGNGNGDNPAVVFEPAFYWYPPIVIERYESNVDNNGQVVRGQDIYTNIFASNYDSWEAITAAIRQIWWQVTINNPIDIDEPEMDEINPYFDSWPRCSSDFGYHQPITRHFVHYDPYIFQWTTIRHFVGKVVVHGEIGFANVGDLDGNGNGNGNGGNALQFQFSRFPAVEIVRHQWVLNNPNNYHAEPVIYTNIFANRYESWQAFSAAIRQLWQQVTDNNNVNAPEIEAINPNSDSWPGCTTDIGFHNKTNGQFIRFDWQVNPWLNIRDHVNSVLVNGPDVDH